mmetsp:Transcript_17095/g.52814  ORF Transcript_17095/g.52814 Transcript_17095/m.52814 type:complete len:225 (-) Transcript_17095:2310-2984(-)
MAQGACCRPRRGASSSSGTATRSPTSSRPPRRPSSPSSRGRAAWSRAARTGAWPSGPERGRTRWRSPSSPCACLSSARWFAASPTPRGGRARSRGRRRRACAPSPAQRTACSSARASLRSSSSPLKTGLTCPTCLCLRRPTATSPWATSRWGTTRARRPRPGAPSYRCPRPAAPCSRAWARTRPCGCGRRRSAACSGCGFSPSVPQPSPPRRTAPRSPSPSRTR